MTDEPGRSLAEAVRPGMSLFVDSSVVLAYLVGGEPSSAEAGQLFDAFIATGRNPTSLSMITVGEVLVHPFRRGPAAVAAAEGFLQHFAAVRLVPVTYEVAREAARLRALTNLPMPDALIVSSARVVDADLLVTNDRSWRPRLADVVTDLDILDLETWAATGLTA